MKSIVDAKQFCCALKKAGSQKRMPKRMRKQVRVDFTDDACRITGSDFSMWLVLKVPAIGDSFSFVFPDAAQAIRLSACHRGALAVELAGSEVTLASENRTGTFPVNSAEDFPLAPKERPAFCRTTDANALVARIGSVSYAVSRNMNRPASCGVWFKDNCIWGVDGYRLAANEDDSFTVKEPFAIHAPLLEQLKYFDRGKLKVAVGKNYVTFTGEGIKMVCRHLRSDDWLHLDKVLPKNASEQYTVNRKQYLSALKYLAECAHGMQRPCVLFEQGQLELDGDHCYYTARIDVDGENEQPYMFNLRYMLEALKQFKDVETLTVNTFGASNHPILLTAGNATAMILPVRMSERPQRRDAAA